MRLKDIVANYPTKEKFNGEIEVNNVYFDSRAVQRGGMFICLNGESENGEHFVEEAIRRGASVIVCEKNNDYKCETVVVDNTRQAFAYFSACFNGNPQNALKIIGVVGTNGKTSTCHIVGRILRKASKKAVIIGTLGVYYDDEFAEMELTTPDPTTLFQVLKTAVQKGVEYAVMEVSAHAIYHKKVSPINFESLIFTNCTQDHLDFFKDFETYKNVKKSIFLDGNYKTAVVNSDDVLGRELLSIKGVSSYAIENPSDVFAVNINQQTSGISYVINVFDSLHEISCPLIGLFNVYNTLASATCCHLLGIDNQTIADALSNIPLIEGRMEFVASKNGGRIYIDYAHTPDGLEKSLLSLRKITKGNLVCLFGCGGNRDKSKRSIMGKIAGDLADFVVLTSDNPRFEEPLKIISEIEKGVRESSLEYICLPIRKQAIKYAIGILEKGDCLLIAGKGAEKYQDVLGVKSNFNDKQIAIELACSND